MVSVTRLTSPAEVTLSLVIPCYNEEGSIPALYARVAAFLTEAPSSEVIFVDNGSTDSTGPLLVSLIERKSRIKIVQIEHNKGYGYGIKKGLEATTGNIIGWTHADLQSDPLDALRGLQIAGGLSEGVFIKGLRSKRSLVDAFFTIGMSVFESILFKTILRDINAQPTLFSRSLLRQVLKGPDDFSLDLFVMVSSRKSGFRELRFPVKFAPRPVGSSKWNTSWKARFRLIIRTYNFSLALAGKKAKP